MRDSEAAIFVKKKKKAFIEVFEEAELVLKKARRQNKFNFMEQAIEAK